MSRLEFGISPDREQPAIFSSSWDLYITHTLEKVEQYHTMLKFASIAGRASVMQPVCYFPLDLFPC